MEAVLTALLLSGSVPILHVCILRLIRKPDLGIRIMYLCFFLYAGLWYLVSLIQNDIEVLTASTWIGGMSIIAFMCLGYMEVFSMICRDPGNHEIRCAAHGFGMSNRVTGFCYTIYLWFTYTFQ